MPEEPNGQQGETPGSEPRSETDQQGGQPGTGDQGATPKIDDPAAVLAALERANAEAARFRRELAQAQQRIKGFEDEKLSESQRLANQVQELESKLQQAEARARDQALRTEVSSIATKLGFLNPGVAHRLIDQSQVEYDGERPKNLEHLLKDLLKSEPYLARTGSADGGSGRRGGSGQNDMNTLIRQAAGRGR